MLSSMGDNGHEKKATSNDNLWMLHKMECEEWSQLCGSIYHRYIDTHQITSAHGKQKKTTLMMVVKVSLRRISLLSVALPLYYEKKNYQFNSAFFLNLTNFYLCFNEKIKRG
jgi:hypothetical protein